MGLLAHKRMKEESKEKEIAENLNDFFTLVFAPGCDGKKSTVWFLFIGSKDEALPESVINQIIALN